MPHALIAPRPPAPPSPVGPRDATAGPADAGATPGAVASCLSPAIFRAAQQNDTGLVLWRRAARLGLNRAIQAALALPPFCTIAEGPPDQAARALLRDMQGDMHALGADIAMLGRRFAAVTADHAIRLRLEHVADDACRRYHVDSVGLRLLCTYAGPGTEWIDPAGQRHQMSAFHVGIFKGAKFPDAAPRILHRSPPVEHLPERRRARLLLCIDQPGVF